MKLTASWNLVRVSDTDASTLSLLRQLLTIRDPRAKKSSEYQQGLWDGYHAYILDEHCTFPSGLLGLVVEGLTRKRVAHTVEFSPRVERDLGWVRGLASTQVPRDLFRKPLRDYQIEAVTRALHGQRGVIFAPPRAGKTLMALAVMQLAQRRSLYVVNRTKLLRQHCESAREYGLTLAPVTAKQIEKGNVGLYAIATVQTLYSALKDQPDATLAYLDAVDVLQGDEIHSLSDSVSWTSVFTSCGAAIRIGYSGTPYQSQTEWDSRDHWLRACCGDLLYQIDPEYLMATGHLMRPRVFAVKAPGSQSLFKATNWTLLYNRGIVTNAQANALVARLAAAAYHGGRRCLVLVAHHEHGHEILRLLRSVHALSAAFSAGGDSTVIANDSKLGYAPVDWSDEQIMQRFRSGEIPVLIGSTIYDQGIDMPFVDTTILAGGWKSPVVCVQRAYRGLTPSEGKRTPILIDMHHTFSVVLGHHSRARAKEIQARVLPGGKIEHASSPAEIDALDALLREAT